MNRRDFFRLSPATVFVLGVFCGTALTRFTAWLGWWTP